MKPTHILTALCLLSLLIAPAAAADSIVNPHTPLLYHPHGFTVADIRDTIEDILANTDLSPFGKLQAQTEALGMDSRLSAWLYAERDKDTGEPIYDTGIPIISGLLSIFGISTPSAPENPYSEDEGRKVWEEYHATFLNEYKPTGEFGGPIK